MSVPDALAEPALRSLLAEVHGREVQLLECARTRVVSWSWIQRHDLAYRPEPFFAERFGGRTPPERTGEPDRPAIWFGRDADGRVALVDIGDMPTLDADHGLRFEAWHEASEGMLLDRRGDAFGAQRREIVDGQVRAFARLTAVPRRDVRYQVESYDYNADGSLSGIRHEGPSAWGHFYMQVVPARAARRTLAFAPRWAIEPTQLPDQAVDRLESCLHSAVADRVVRLLGDCRVANAMHYVALDEPTKFPISYATEAQRLASRRRRTYRPFDFYLFGYLEEVSASADAFADLAASYELLVKELTKRRKQSRLDRFTADVALSLNRRTQRNDLPFVDDPLFIARPVGPRRDVLRAIKASIPKERWRLLESQEQAYAQEQAARQIGSISRRSAKTRLMRLVHDAGCDERNPNPQTPRELFHAFIRFLEHAIKGIDERNDDVLFEVFRAHAGATQVTVSLVRQLSLYDREENYRGMDTIRIDLEFSITDSEPVSNETIWADPVLRDSWASHVRESAGFATFFDGRRTPSIVQISQEPVDRERQRVGNGTLPPDE